MPAAKVDDRSEDHLRWLVRSRSQNQGSSLDLYLLLAGHPTINADIGLQQIAQSLTAVAFSLWRAVFLSDLKSTADDQMADLNAFLGNLISNNTVAYQQDKNAREFTYRYYLTDAQLRLSEIVTETPAILSLREFTVVNADVKSEWTAAQAALDTAIGHFGELLASA